VGEFHSSKYSNIRIYTVQARGSQPDCWRARCRRIGDDFAGLPACATVSSRRAAAHSDAESQDRRSANASGRAAWVARSTEIFCATGHCMDGIRKGFVVERLWKRPRARKQSPSPSSSFGRGPTRIPLVKNLFVCRKIDCHQRREGPRTAQNVPPMKLSRQSYERGVMWAVDRLTVVDRTPKQPCLQAIMAA